MEWNGNNYSPLWYGLPQSITTTSNSLYIVEGGDGSNPQIGIIDGNEIYMASNYDFLTVNSLLANNIGALSNLIANTIIASNIYVDNLTAVETINALSTIATPLLQFPYGTNVTGYLSTLYVNGVPLGAPIPNESNVDQWATFEAVTDINAANHNILNANQTTTQILQVNRMNALNGVGIDFNAYNISNIQYTVTENLQTNHISSKNANSISFNSNTLTNIAVGKFSSITTNVIGADIGYFSTLYVSSFGGGASNIASNWAFYPALANVNVNGKNVNNVATLGSQSINNSGNINTNDAHTNALTVNGTTQLNGQTYHSGGIQIGGTGNLLQPYWYNFVEDANIFTANNHTIYPPTNNQYFANSHRGINCLDIESVFSGLAFEAAYEDMNVSGWVIPTGNINHIARGYTLLFPYIPNPLNPFDYKTGSFRGYATIGAGGSGCTATIGFNQDVLTSKLPWQGGLIQINADSHLLNTLTGAGRVSITSGVGQNYQSFTNEMSAGSLGIDPIFNHVCSFLQDASYFGNLGGGVTTNTVRAGFPSYYAGRNDMAVIAPVRGTLLETQTEMNIYSTHNMWLYTEGDLWVGYGQAIPRYGTNLTQRVHLAQVTDITGAIDASNSGLNMVNVNSIQGYSSNSFIANIKYLVGVSEGLDYPNEFQIQNIPVVSTLTYYPITTSNTQYFSTAFYSSLSTLSSIPYTVSTINVSSFIASNFSFVSTQRVNLRNASSFTSNISDIPFNKYNYLYGMSTILSSFTTNLTGNAYNVIKNLATSNILAGNIITSNITTSNFTTSNVRANHIYTDYLSPNSNANISVTSDLQMNYNSLDNINTVTTDYLAATTNPEIVVDSSLQLNYNNIENVQTVFTDYIQNAENDLIIANSRIDMNYNWLTGAELITADIITPVTTDHIDFSQTILSNINYVYTNGIWMGDPNTDQFEEVRFASYPSSSLTPPFYVSYATADNSAANNFTPVAADWSAFAAYQDVDMSNNNINNINGLTTSFINVDYINTNITGYVDFVGGNVQGINNLFASSVSSTYGNFDSISAFTVYGSINVYSPMIMNGVYITGLAYIQFQGGNAIAETNYGGSNYLILANDTIVSSNLIILDGVNNPTLIFDSGKKGYIDFYSDFTFSSNINMSNNSISNVYNLATTRINNVVVPIQQYGKSTVGSTITLSPSYTNSTSYAINLTYTGSYTSNYLPLYSSNVAAGSFTIQGTAGKSVYWTTIGT